TEYGFQAGLPRDFDPTIYLLDPRDVPLQGMYNADGRTVLARKPATQIKVEWQDEELLLPRSAVHDNPLTNVATKLTLPSDQDRLRFQTGDVLKIEDEHVLVLGYEAGTGELEIQRGFQSTTPAQHAQGTPVVGLGSALPEGSDPKEVRALDRVD